MLAPASQGGCSLEQHPCDARARVPLHKIIIINNNSSINLVLSSYRMPCWELNLNY